MHPFRFAAYMRESSPVQGEQDADWPPSGVRAPQLLEMIVLNWICEIISAILVLMVFAGGQYFSLLHPLLRVSPPSVTLVLLLGFSLAFSPLFLVIEVAVNKWLLRTFAGLYLSEEELERHLDNVLALSLCAGVMMTIPFVGTIFRSLLRALLLFAGLKNTYQLSFVQITVVLLLPWVFIALLVAAVVWAIVLLFSVGGIGLGL